MEDGDLRFHILPRQDLTRRIIANSLIEYWKRSGLALGRFCFYYAYVAHHLSVASYWVHLREGEAGCF